MINKERESYWVSLLIAFVIALLLLEAIIVIEGRPIENKIVSNVSDYTQYGWLNFSASHCCTDYVIYNKVTSTWNYLSIYKSEDENEAPRIYLNGERIV